MVERTELPPPIARTVYTLSDDGWRLVLPILGAVARFGLQTMRYSVEESRSPLNGFLVGVLLGFDPVGAVGVEATYRVQIDGRIRFRRDRRTACRGAARTRRDLERISIRPGDRSTGLHCNAASDGPASMPLRWQTRRRRHHADGLEANEQDRRGLDQLRASSSC